jgi:hypothetical protein
LLPDKIKVIDEDIPSGSINNKVGKGQANPYPV